MLWLLWALWGCSGPAEEVDEQPPPLRVDHGVDVGSKLVRVGVLVNGNDPRTTALHAGRQGLVKAIEAGSVDVLDEGWRVELVPVAVSSVDEATAGFERLQSDVLFFASLGSAAQTSALHPLLAKHEVVGTSDDLVDALNGFERTPVLGASAVTQAQAGKRWATAHGATELAVVMGVDAESRAAAAGLQDAKVFDAASPVVPDGSYVLAAASPTELAPWFDAVPAGSVTWIGTTRAWGAGEIARASGHTWVQLSDLAWVGEDVAGMPAFREALGPMATPASERGWVQLAVMLEGAKRAIRQGDATRFGYRMALQNITGFRPADLSPPFTLRSFPYEALTEVRVLAHDGKTGWKVAE